MSTPAPTTQGDLLSSCMGGLGQSSTKWLAEQNRKRALKTLEPVTKFSKEPEKHPCTVCFEYAGTGLTHKTVKAAAEKTISRYRDTKVVTIQFMAKSVILSSMWVENRWVVRVNNENAQRALTVSGVNIFGKDVKCRRYDDVLAEEYKRFLEKEERTE